MSGILFGQGKQNIAGKAMNLGSDTLKASLLSMATSGGKIQPITAATNATPIVVTTSAAHGYSAGDIVVVGQVGGNLAANGTWKVGTTTSTTFQLLTRLDGNASQGSGSYTSGGSVINVSTAATLADVSANTLGTDVTFTGNTNTLGVINAANPTWSGLPNTQACAVVVYDSTASNDLVAFVDGRFQLYVCAQAAVSATTIVVQRLPVAIDNGTVITFSDGSSATLTAGASVGDSTLTVSSLAAIVHRQATADVPTSGVGIPMTPGVMGSLLLSIDTGPNKLLVI